MGRLIDEDDAIELIYGCPIDEWKKCEIAREIRILPSAQPEIVRCMDCKWKQGSECVRFAEVRPFPDDFCSRA